MLQSIDEVIERFGHQSYVCSRSIATVVYLSVHLKKPILVEGPAGVGKTELAKVLAAQKFNQGYATLEYIEAAQVDLAWHLIDSGQAPAASSVPGFEAAALRDAGLEYAPIQPRYHSGYFSHIFAGGYSAGYYAYLWSEVLARDTGQWFHTHGGLTRANGDTLRRMVLSRGRTDDPFLRKVAGATG